MRLFLRRFPVLGGLQLFALLCAALASAGYFRGHAATLLVTTTADSGPGSLRAAIVAASDGDTIQFDSALNGQTIALTSGELAIDRNITINGPGPVLLTISRDQQAFAFRIFHVTPGHTVMIRGLTISGGVATGGGVLNDQATLTLDTCTVSGNTGGFSASGTSAGGIFNGGTMTISGSTVSGNVANVAGGIDNFGTLVIRNTAVSNNRSNFFNPPPSGGSAGGIENVGTLEISSSTISNNGADVFGGGIVNYGMMTVTDSTVSSNVAAGMFGTGTGGGISNGGSHAEIHNSTVSSNLVDGDGGGINSAGPLTITNSIISDNRASQNGGGIFNVGGNTILEIGDTVLKASAFGTNIFNSGGTVTSRGYNLSSDNGGGFLTATGDQINTDPMLGPLQNNGGPTFTHNLLTGSPAIDAGDPNFTPPPFTDQRGYLRVFNGRIDIGSLEVQPLPTPTPTPTPGPATHFAVSAPGFVGQGSPFPLTVTAQDQFNNTAQDYMGTVHFTSTDSTAELPVDSTLTNGARTFNATLHMAAGQTITATDTSNASITGTSNIIFVEPVEPTPPATPTIAPPSPTPSPTPSCIPGGSPGPWATASPGPPPRYRAGGVTDGTSIYVFGGGNEVAPYLNDLWRWTPATQTWTQLANMPTGKQNIQGAYWNGKIYVPGGWIGFDITENAIYDIATNTWSTGAPLPAAQTGTNVAFNNKIYNFGGSPGPQSTTTIYDIATNTWSAGAAMPVATYYGRAVTVGGFAYYVGGIGAAVTNAVHRYDIATNTWTPMSSLQTRRTSEELMASPDGSMLFSVMGGDGGVFTGVPEAQSVEIYNIAGNSWTYGNPVVFRGAAPSGGLAGGKLMVVGGVELDIVFDIVQVSQLPLGCLTPTPTPASPTPTIPPTPTPTPTCDGHYPPCFGLAVMKTDSPDPVQVSHELTYTITVSNTDPFTLTGVTMIDPLPAGVNYVSVAPSQGTCTGTSKISCDLGSLPAFATATVILVVAPTVAGTLNNTAFVSDGHSDTQVTTVIPPIPSPSPTPTPTLTPTPSPTPTSTPTPSVTPSRLFNLSTRMLVQTGDKVGIGGFIIMGSVPKQVLLRGIGPSLAQFGVPNALADPAMELHGPAGFTTIVNDNWRDTQAIVIIATGIPPIDDLESAILATLAPGAYTAIVKGNNDTSGVALVEVYDLGPAASKLANISTRAFVSTGTNVTIGGFILGGDADSHIVIRGIGPSLAASGVSGALADPTLELRDSNGALLAFNDNCEASPPFPPTNPLEACIDVSLPPAAYTAILAGKNGGTGIGLVEIYNLQ